MASYGQFTLYTAKICPWAHRVELALQEAEIPYTRYEINLQDKPEWFTAIVNPAGKTPAVTYGGPIVPPDQPSLESLKLAESALILEFIADLISTTDPDNTVLLPKDPAGRYKARFFAETIVPRISALSSDCLVKGGDPGGVLDVIDTIQELLPKSGGGRGGEEGKYALGSQWSLADASLTPFLARAELIFGNDLGRYPLDRGKQVWEVVETAPKYERFRRYFEELKKRGSYDKTFDAEALKVIFAIAFPRF